jgi:hypothetical protein
MYNWYQFHHAFIHTYTSVILCTVYSWRFPLRIPPFTYLAPSCCDASVLLSPRLLVNCPPVPHCSPMFPASLPSGLPRNPNVLLIRTHPNPSPSVANSKYWEPMESNTRLIIKPDSAELARLASSSRDRPSITPHNASRECK